MSDPTQLELFTEDSETLNTVFRQISPIGNKLTGVGTNRDSSQYLEITEIYPLQHNERINLYRSSQIAKNIVTVYPEEASWFEVNFGSNKYTAFGIGAQKVNDYFNKLKTGSLENKFRVASIEARLHGEAYLILGINDGLKFYYPVAEDRITSIDWVEVLTYDQVIVSDKNKDIYEIFLTNELPDSRVTRSEQTNYKGERKLEVHKSRMVKIIGDFNPPSILKVTKKHESAIQAAFDGLSLALQGLMTSNAMLQDYSLFWYKLDGLANLIRAKKYDEIYARFMSIQMSKSVIKGIALDAKNEDVGFVQRSYSGVKDILETMIDYMVAETGMVRFKVLGSANRAGLGAEGRGLQDRLEHSLKLKAWQKLTWFDPLQTITRLGLLAKDSPTKGRLPKALNLSFPPVLELDPAEIAELYSKNMTWVKAAIDAGLIEPLEGRVSLFNSSQVILNPQILLDTRVTDMMEQELERKIDEFESATGEEIEQTNEQQSELEEETEENDPVDVVSDLVTSGLDSEVDFNEWLTNVDEYNQWNEDGSYPMLVWFCDPDGGNKHRTPIAVRVSASSPEQARSKAIAAARKKCTRHCGSTYGVRQATESEKKTAASGNWIRTGSKGQKTGYKGVKGVGPSLKDSKEDAPNYRKGNSVLNCSECIHHRLSTNDPEVSKTPWMNCDKYDFETSSRAICDSFDEIDMTTNDSDRDQSAEVRQDLSEQETARLQTAIKRLSKVTDDDIRTASN